MAGNHENIENKPEAFIPEDRVGLIALADSYEKLLESDVLLVRQDSVPEIVETSRELAQKIENEIGPMATVETVTIRMIAVSEAERKTLEMARRVRPNVLTKKQFPKYNSRYAS